ncbi:hypothetical protein ACQ4LE_010294 [Meloidogyne hapla]|uniref:Uncharacterized protein n=1 Tax=Meloidogyne hapla TaxID=6305 RepID=A0A1I8BV43_MELHA
MFITSPIPFNIIAMPIILIASYVQQNSGMVVHSTGQGTLPNILKMESRPIFASGSASFANLPMRKINKISKIMATNSTNSQKPVIEAEKTLVDNKKVYEPKYINGFEKKSFSTKEGLQVEKVMEENVNQASGLTKEKFNSFNENHNNLEETFNEEKLKQEKLKKKQEGKGEKGVEYYKNYITEKVQELTKEIFVYETEETSTTNTSSSTKQTENISLATDLLMNIREGPKRDNYKEKAAELAFVLNICDKFVPERGFIGHSKVILLKHANPQPDLGTQVRELELIPKLWSLLGVQKGYKQENYYQYVDKTFERLSNLVNQGTHNFLLDFATENAETKEKAQKKLELTKRLMTDLQFVLFETNNLLDWEAYYDGKKEENQDENGEA